MISIPLHPSSEIVSKHVDIPTDEIREWCEQASTIFESTNHSHHYFGDHQEDLYFHDEVSSAIDSATGYRPTHFWMQFYEWKDHMTAHTHRDTGNQIVRCGILYLDNIGATTFICDKGPGQREELTIPSEAGLVVTFPPDMLHYVVPHCVIGKMRYTLPFNCIEK